MSNRQFVTHDEVHFTQYLLDVASGKKRVSGSTLLPHELVYQSAYSFMLALQVSPAPQDTKGPRLAHYRKKRKFELGRQPINTKLGAKRIHTVRVRGGNVKHRALRLDTGNFAWGSEHVTRKARLIGVVRPVL